MHHLRRSKKKKQIHSELSGETHIQVSSQYNLRERKLPQKKNYKEEKSEDEDWETEKSFSITKSQENLPTNTFQNNTFEEDEAPSDETSSEESEENITNNMAADALQQALATLADRPVSIMHPKVFTGTEGEDIIIWLDKFERIARNNRWNEEKQAHSIPLYLDKTALIFYENLQAETKANQQLVKDALRAQYHSQDRKWRLRSDLYAVTQKGSLTQYIDDLETLCHQLGIDEPTKTHHFIHGLLPHLKEALVLRQPADYNTAVQYAKLKESMSATSYEDRFKRLERELLYKKELENQQSSQSNNINYGDPVKMSQELARLKAENRQLKRQGQFQSNTNGFKPIQRNLRTVDGQPVCNRCQRVGHTWKAFPDLNQRNYQNQNNQQYSTKGQHQQGNQYRSNNGQYNSNKLNNQQRPNQNWNYNQNTRGAAHQNNYLNSYSYPQDGVYRSNQQQDNTNQAFGSIKGRRSNIPRNQNQQQPPQTNTITNHIDEGNLLNTLISGKINGHQVKMLVDSGSVANIIDCLLFDKVKATENKITPTTMKLVGADSNYLEVLGETSMEITVDDQVFTTKLVVTKNLIQPLILGINFLKKYKGVLDFATNQIVFKKDDNAFKEAKAVVVPALLTNTQEDKLEDENTSVPTLQEQTKTETPKHSSSMDGQQAELGEMSSTESLLNGKDIILEQQSETLFPLDCELDNKSDYIFHPDEKLLTG